MDDLCDGCGADLNQTDGNTFAMDDGTTMQLCPDCSAADDDEESDRA